MDVKRTSMALAVLMCAVPLAKADLVSYFNDPWATENISLDGVAWDGFVMPYVDGEIDKAATDTALVANVSMKDALKAFTHAIMEASRAYLFSGNSNPKDVFIKTLVGELGYAGARALLHQLGFDTILSDNNAANFNAFAAPYLKRVIAVALQDIWSTTKLTSSNLLSSATA